MDIQNFPPIAQYILVIVAVFGAIVASAKPLMAIVRQRSEDNKLNKIDSIEVSLYSSLSEQISRLSNQITDLQKDNIILREENSELKIRIAKLEDYEQRFERVSIKLDEKDAEIRHRELKIHEMFEAIRRKDTEISQLRERVSHLESIANMAGSTISITSRGSSEQSSDTQPNASPGMRISLPEIEAFVIGDLPIKTG